MTSRRILKTSGRFLAISLGLLMAHVASAAKGAALDSSRLGCFSPTQDPIISGYLKPNPNDHETAATIEEMHRLIYDNRELIDPRLVYRRIIGEALAAPEQLNLRGDGGYGIFQFTGRPEHSRYTYRQILEQRYRENPGVSHRLIQLKYYFEEYVPAAANAADAGYGCNRAKRFSDYSNLEKVAYLGWGRCNGHALQKELALCQHVATYRNGACSFSQEFITGINGMNHQPLCYEGTAETQLRSSSGPQRINTFNVVRSAGSW